jgi:hypothetical protein
MERVMRKLYRLLLGGALLLIAASTATCFFGVRYAISQIPPEEIARRGDTDWIGVEWLLRGGLLLVIAVALVLIALILWLYQRIMSKRRGKLP